MNPLKHAVSKTRTSGKGQCAVVAIEQTTRRTSGLPDSGRQTPHARGGGGGGGGRGVDEAGIDVILVGDSLGNVVLGYGNTVPVTLDEILIHVKAVRRAVQRALLVADMPYGSFHVGEDEAVKNALRLVKEGGAEAIKLEGGHKRVALVKRLVDEEISVMGHIGLTPQSINQLGRSEERR